MLKNDKEMLADLRSIQKDKQNWKNNIRSVGEKLDGGYSDEVKAKALWVFGEIGLKYPAKTQAYVEIIAGYLDDENPKLRQRALNALGRIGRGDRGLVVPYLDKLMKSRHDGDGDVRLAFVWACENIATNSPELFCGNLDVFFEMISDSYEKVRMESPEMFRVMGKRKPHCVKPYLENLQRIAQNDSHPIVRIHCEGAVRITKNALGKS